MMKRLLSGCSLLLLFFHDVDSFLPARAPRQVVEKARRSGPLYTIFDEQKRKLDEFLHETIDQQKRKIDGFVIEKKEQLSQYLPSDWTKTPQQRDWKEFETAFENANAIDQGMPRQGRDGIYEILTEQQFHNFMLENSGRLVILKFTTSYCQACKKLDQHFRHLQEDPRFNNDLLEDPVVAVANVHISHNRYGTLDDPFGDFVTFQLGVVSVPQVRFYANAKKIETITCDRTKGCSWTDIKHRIVDFVEEFASQINGKPFEFPVEVPMVTMEAPMAVPAEDQSVVNAESMAAYESQIEQIALTEGSIGRAAQTQQMEEEPQPEDVDFGYNVDYTQGSDSDSDTQAQPYQNTLSNYAMYGNDQVRGEAEQEEVESSLQDTSTQETPTSNFLQAPNQVAPVQEQKAEDGLQDTNTQKAPTADFPPPFQVPNPVAPAQEQKAEAGLQAANTQEVPTANFPPAVQAPNPVLAAQEQKAEDGLQDTSSRDSPATNFPPAFQAPKQLSQEQTSVDRPIQEGKNQETKTTAMSYSSAAEIDSNIGREKQSYENIFSNSVLNGKSQKDTRIEVKSVAPSTAQSGIHGPMSVDEKNESADTLPKHSLSDPNLQINAKRKPVSYENIFSNSIRHGSAVAPASPVDKNEVDTPENMNKVTAELSFEGKKTMMEETLTQAIDEIKALIEQNEAEEQITKISENTSTGFSLDRINDMVEGFEDEIKTLMEDKDDGYLEHQMEVDDTIAEEAALEDESGDDGGNNGSSGGNVKEEEAAKADDSTEAKLGNNDDDEGAHRISAGTQATKADGTELLKDMKVEEAKDVTMADIGNQHASVDVRSIESSQTAEELQHSVDSLLRDVDSILREVESEGRHKPNMDIVNFVKDFAQQVERENTRKGEENSQKSMDAGGDSTVNTLLKAAIKKVDQAQSWVGSVSEKVSHDDEGAEPVPKWMDKIFNSDVHLKSFQRKFPWQK